MNKFKFDTRSRRYRYTSGSRNGQFVSTSAITKLVEDYMIQQRRDMATTTDLLLSGKMNADAWKFTVANTLKHLHINAYSIGKGGIGRLTESDVSAISNRLKSEFSYLERFADQLNGLSDAQVKNRINLYVDAAHSQWQSGSEVAAIASGMKFERWISARDKETCVDCSGKASLGWQPIGRLGVPGVSVRCLGRCRCNKVYDSQVGLLDRADGWVA